MFPNLKKVAKTTDSRPPPEKRPNQESDRLRAASLQNHMKAFKLGHKEFEKKIAEKDSPKKLEQKMAKRYFLPGEY